MYIEGFSKDSILSQCEMNGSRASSSMKSTLTTNSSIMHCPVWTWKVDRMWDLQQKLAQQQKSTEDTVKGQESTMKQNTNYFIESLKFGADLQRNFLQPQNTDGRKKIIVDNNEEDTKSFYMFDYNTKKSNYF